MTRLVKREKLKEFNRQHNRNGRAPRWPLNTNPKVESDAHTRNARKEG